MFEERFLEVSITINKIISDCKLALMEVVPDEVFYGVEAKGYWFHYAQAIIRREDQQGLSRFYKTDGVVAHIFQEIIGLTLILADRIYEGFVVINLIFQSYTLINLPKGLLNHISAYGLAGNQSIFYYSFTITINIHLQQNIRRTHRRSLEQKTQGS
jgi:hypothetical protein